MDILVSTIQIIIIISVLAICICLIQNDFKIIKDQRKIKLNTNDKIFESLYNKFHLKFLQRVSLDNDYTFTRCFNETFIESQENIINVEKSLR